MESLEGGVTKAGAASLAPRPGRRAAWKRGRLSKLQSHGFPLGLGVSRDQEASDQTRQAPHLGAPKPGGGQAGLQGKGKTTAWQGLSSPSWRVLTGERTTRPSHPPPTSEKITFPSACLSPVSVWVFRGAVIVFDSLVELLIQENRSSINHAVLITRIS